jgi:hypothetical protein
MFVESADSLVVRQQAESAMNIATRSHKLTGSNQKKDRHRFLKRKLEERQRTGATCRTVIIIIAAT